jgi:ADP-ribose pyrophosphatase YjhB (NUDIX family)
MNCIAHKVTALIVREAPAGRQVLLFRHPSAGVQVPAGTVEEGEDLEAAALREGQEESGVRDLRVVRRLATLETVLPGAGAVMGRTATVYSRPDVGSWDWARVQRGLYVEVLRREGEWVQIDFREANRFPDPEYDTFRIVGWVPAEVICPTVHRHFYLLVPTAATPSAEWAVEIDYHVFRPFWASLDELLANDGAPIIGPQRPWINYLRDLPDATSLQSRSPRPFP